MKPAEIIKNLADAINSHNPKAVAAFYSDDALLHDPFYSEALNGVSAIEKDFADFVRAFPDLRFEIQTIMSEGTTVAAEGIVIGTNTGPMATPDGEFPATGRKMKMYFAGFDRLNENGKIVEEHRYYNVAGIMEQLGLTQLAQT